MPRDSELRDALEHLIRTRRTVKSFGAEPIPHDVLTELFDLARWAPNHRLNEPWRFRVLGPMALQQLEAAAGEGAAKLRRAPTLVAVSCVLSGNEVHDREDVCATSCAMYIAMLAAHARGIASYWRTPGVLRQADGRRACGIADGEREIGLLHLGWAAGSVEAPARSDLSDVMMILQ